MQSERSCRTSCRGPSLRRPSSSSVDLGHAGVEPFDSARRARRFSGSRELALHALHREVAVLRAQLAASLVREAQARTLARTDSLTRLSNRGAFLEQLQNALGDDARQSERVAVLFIDLDGFKSVNDRHGHRVGDELLRVVGERLSANVRASDVVARLGGDEFACLIRRCGSRERVSQVAGKLFDALSDGYQLGPARVQVRASLGIATSPEDGAAAAALLERADAAMYRAKRSRTGCEFFSPAQPAPAALAAPVEGAWIFGARDCRS